MNVIARLELELTYYDVEVQLVSHYTAENPLSFAERQSEYSIFPYFLFCKYLIF